MVIKKTVNISRRIFEFSEQESFEINKILRNTLANYMHSRSMILGPEMEKINMLFDPVPGKPGFFKIMAVIEESVEDDSEEIVEKINIPGSIN